MCSIISIAWCVESHLYASVLERYQPHPTPSHMRDVAHPQRSIICMPTCLWTYNCVASHLYARVLERYQPHPTPPYPIGEVLAPRVYIYIYVYILYICHYTMIYHLSTCIFHMFSSISVLNSLWFHARWQWQRRSWKDVHPRSSPSHLTIVKWGSWDGVFWGNQWGIFNKQWGINPVR